MKRQEWSRSWNGSGEVAQPKSDFYDRKQALLVSFLSHDAPRQIPYISSWQLLSKNNSAMIPASLSLLPNSLCYICNRVCSTVSFDPLCCFFCPKCPVCPNSVMQIHLKLSSMHSFVAHLQFPPVGPERPSITTQICDDLGRGSLTAEITCFPFSVSLFIHINIYLYVYKYIFIDFY